MRYSKTYNDKCPNCSKRDMIIIESHPYRNNARYIRVQCKNCKFIKVIIKNDYQSCYLKKRDYVFFYNRNTSCVFYDYCLNYYSHIDECFSCDNCKKYRKKE